MKLVIHAGAHRTEATAIQQWLKQSTQPLAEHGVLFLEPDILNRSGIIDGLHKAGKSEHKKMANRFLSLLSEKSAKSRINTLLISHESILSYSNMLPETMHKGFYGSLENSARCINILAEEYELKLVFYVRRQDTFMASIYSELLERGNTILDFAEYCKAIDYRLISWFSLLERMSVLLSRAEIVVRPYEFIEKGDVFFIREFLRTAGIKDDEKLLSLGLSDLNHSISETALKLIRACGPHLAGNDQRQLAQYLTSRFPASKYGRADILSPALSSEIVSHFADENARMFKLWMPDYSDLFY